MIKVTLNDQERCQASLAIHFVQIFCDCPEHTVNLTAEAKCLSALELPLLPADYFNR
jgi:hypothetical protein